MHPTERSGGSLLPRPWYHGRMIGLVPSFATAEEAAAFLRHALGELTTIIAAGGAGWTVVIGSAENTGANIGHSPQLGLVGLTSDYWKGIVAALAAAFPAAKPPKAAPIDPVSVQLFPGFEDARVQVGTLRDLRTALESAPHARTFWEAHAVAVAAVGVLVVAAGFTAAVVAARRRQIAQRPARRGA